MTTRPLWLCVPLLLSLTSLIQPLQAEKLLVNWEELEPLVAGRMVSLVLPDGRVPKGRVLEVRPDSIVLGIRAGTPIEIDRESVNVLMVGRRGVKWRVLTTILGAAAGFFSGMLVADAAFDERWSAEGAGLSGGLATAGAFGGYYLGFSLDSRSVTWISVRR